MAFSNISGSAKQIWMLYHDFVKNIEYEYYSGINMVNYGFFSKNGNILTYKATISTVRYPTDIIVFSEQALVK